MSENSINKFGLNIGIFFINFIFIDSRLYMYLNESSIYSLEITTQPFHGNTDNLTIEFDKSDSNKYYNYIN